MLKTVPIASLKPNPFRRLDEYPIDRDKVDALKESIEVTGFWGTICGRPQGDSIEIAFGHHRLAALQELQRGGFGDRVEVIVRPLSNEDMLQIMARENMEEWGTSAWVELETIRAVIDAYGRGLIELPPVPEKTRKDMIRHVTLDPVLHPYTKSTVAEFLGWTKKNNDNDLQPNSACEVAFRAMDLIDTGFLEEADLKGLSRIQMKAIVENQWKVYQSEMTLARFHESAADQAKKRAADATQSQVRAKYEAQTKHHEQHARVCAKAATQKAKHFGKTTAAEIRSGNCSVRDVKLKAEFIRDPVPRTLEKVHTCDAFANKLAQRLESLAEPLASDAAFLKKNKDSMSPEAIRGLYSSFQVAIDRLQRMQAGFKDSSPSPKFHHAETGKSHDQKAIADR